MACAAVIAAAGLALTLVAAEPPVRIGTEAPFPPYTYLDAAGTITGFERDVGDEVCRRAVLTCEWEHTRFDALLPGVMSGRFDIVMGGIAVTPERMRLVDFSLSYNESSDTDLLYGREDAPPPAAARVGVQSGTIQEHHARKKGWATTSFASEAEVLAALRAGQVDLAFGTIADAETEAALAAEGLFSRFEEDVPDMGTAMAVCRGNTALLTRINAALEAMVKDGTIDEITARWL